MKYYIGIDIGGTKTAIVLGDNRPHFHKRIQIKTSHYAEPARALDFITEQTIELVRDQNLQLSHIEAIGICCGGPLDSKQGLILSPPNLPGWDCVPIIDTIQKKTGIKTFLQNDANAGALAEWRWGAGKGAKNLVFLTFGTGFGAGLILNGYLYSGTNDMAGEIGHIRLTEFGPSGYGKPGAIEGYCSGGGIAQIARTVILSKWQTGNVVRFCRSKQELEKLSAESVGTAAETDDETAKEILALSGHYLGKALSVLIDLLNPERIILGSIYIRCRRFLEPEMKKAIYREALSRSADVCQIVPAELCEAIGDYAGLAIAMQAGNK